MKQQRKQIRLDEQAETDADAIRAHFNLSSRSAAIRYALREVARGVVRSEVRSEVPTIAGNVPEVRGTAEK